MDPAVRTKIIQKLGFEPLAIEYTQPALQEDKPKCHNLLLCVNKRYLDAEGAPSAPIAEWIAEFFKTLMGKKKSRGDADFLRLASLLCKIPHIPTLASASVAKVKQMADEFAKKHAEQEAAAKAKADADAAKAAAEAQAAAAKKAADNKAKAEADAAKAKVRASRLCMRACSTRIRRLTSLRRLRPTPKLPPPSRRRTPTPPPPLRLRLTLTPLPPLRLRLMLTPPLLRQRPTPTLLQRCDILLFLHFQSITYSLPLTRPDRRPRRPHARVGREVRA